MNILDRLRAHSPLLRAAQALLCAVFLLNLAAHFSHFHEPKQTASSERLICQHCCTFSGVIGPAKSTAIPQMAAAFSTLVAAGEEGRLLSRPAIAHWARGPPVTPPALPMSFS